mmetsp:Transcript_1959/g.5486  ORF Transcript_1959/g.5486 Transcript_1959/m.5486 type:complete len:273 (-) Transcript_1959:806-1624(-)
MLRRGNRCCSESFVLPKHRLRFGSCFTSFASSGCCAGCALTAGHAEGGTMGPLFSALAPARFLGAAPPFDIFSRRPGGKKSGTGTSAGDHMSMSTPWSARTMRRSCSPALASSRGKRCIDPCGGGASRCAGGIRANNGCKAAASAPRATASRKRSAAPGGASFTFSASAKGTSANVASSGSATQTCRELRQSRKRNSAESRSCAKRKSCGQEKPRNQRVLPPTVCGKSTARRQRPLSAMLSTASDNIGDECLPGNFGSKLKNCMSRDAVAMA